MSAIVHQYQQLKEAFQSKIDFSIMRDFSNLG